MGLGNANIDRHRDLLALIHLELDTRKLGELLANYEWDWDGQPVVLSLADVRQAIGKFKRGEISGGELEWWADAIEIREDISYQSKYEDSIRCAVFALANPSIHEGDYASIVDETDTKLEFEQSNPNE